jgi:anti-sigma regulatory factor (Ser/Thr protein kinase)
MIPSTPAAAGSPEVLVTEIGGGPLAAPAARRLVTTFAHEISADCLIDASLMISELVNNSVEHGGAGNGSFVRLVIDVCEGVLKVEVSDSGSGFVPPASLSFDDVEATSGRGLRIVEALADRWGVTTSEGAHVWFEMAATRDH